MIPHSVTYFSAKFPFKSQYAHAGIPASKWEYLSSDLSDKNEYSMSGIMESDCPEVDVKDVPEQNPDTLEKAEVNKMGTKTEENIRQDSGHGDAQLYGDVNMEASITSDDVLRAGGFGARDDINSFLPVAIDSTDFEASLRDARDYEEPQGQACRPGLGWKEVLESNEH